MLFLQLLKKRFTELNILGVLRKVNLFNHVSIGFCKSTVEASNSLTIFLSISNSSLLVILGCYGQFLESPNHSSPFHQNSQSFLSSQLRLPKSGGLFLVGTFVFCILYFERDLQTFVRLLIQGVVL